MSDHDAGHTDPGDSYPPVARFWPVVSAAVALALVLILAGIIALRPTEPFWFDLSWMGELLEHRAPVWTVLAVVMNDLGGGIIGVVVVPVGAVIVLLAIRRPWAALYFAVSVAVSASFVQLLKITVGRARPEDMLVTSDAGSFPSGHTANAATLVVVFGIVFPRLWVWVIGGAYAVLMALSRTYLGAHWFSDTVGGLLLGGGVAVIVWAPFATRLLRERSLPRLDPHPQRPDSRGKSPF